MLYVIGLGPGDQNLLTAEARQIIQQTPIIVGYVTYIKLVSNLLKDKTVIQNGMHGEVERCQKALDLASEGQDVAIISSGDAGIYGMAGLIWELKSKQQLDVSVKVIPGITASIAAAAHLGAPLMNDFCHISLSDLMTPWEVVVQRVEAAAQADFVICLYNPRSNHRPHKLRQALDIILKYKAPTTVVGVGTDVARLNEVDQVTTIADLDETTIGMTSIVIIGNKNTYAYQGKMITPRGYQL